MNEDFLSYCLNEIEKKEISLIVWGFVDSYFSHFDLYDFLEPILQYGISNQLTGISDADLLIEELVGKGLIHRFYDRNDAEKLYRSRMNESVRLMSKLRQLFPKHEGNNEWREGATLVGDYRFQSKPRRFPQRNLSIEHLISKLQDLNLSKIQLEIINNLIGTNFKISGFQERAIIDILSKVNSNKNSGSIVCAGTGSGKTLSFYLPSLTRIGSHIIENNKPWVKVLAIYPRNELLKDQFSEIYAESRKLDKYLKSKSRRKIILGAFFGPTPKDTKVFLNQTNSNLNGWEKVSDGYSCEYIRCITPDCKGKLIWSINDINKEIERLKCDFCSHIIEEDEVILTRERMVKNPPDILFTSTEMLNQRMSDNKYNHLFGIGSKALKAPELMLLDEAHTYSGIHGAQVSYLIKRWRNLVGSNTVFVGLSATLNNAQQFFSTLVGLDKSKVDEISPSFDELEKKGAEYNIVLRGDPVSKRSLLSTTIQTTMLTSRILDKKDKKISDGYFGSKVFVFTDDIDVTNRLYFNVLDSEGKDSWGRPNLKDSPNGGLAYLREEGTNFERYESGQDWRFCQDLQHNLHHRMEVGRTSSQDPGTNSEDDIIVATASLEVGFNDPDVGAVIQHKAPHDMAQFIQRKGRAGRSTKMRPWTIVVLSDYGRDRNFYQSYEQIFDPELKTRHIPINNKHVQRMQSVYSLIDYLGYRLQNYKEGSVWSNLSSPLTGDYKNYENNVVKPRLDQIKKELINILQSDQSLKNFEDFLSKSLNLKGDCLRSILWDFPRSLMTIVIPKIINRIESNWIINGDANKKEHYKFNSPLMEFIPSTLFSDLNLPEVEILLNKEKDGSENTVLMPIFQAMKDFAPGRVSKRFTIEHTYISHWISSEDLSLENDLELNAFSISNYIGEFNILDDESNIKKIKVYRPIKLLPIKPPKKIGDTSNAQLKWVTEIVTDYTPLNLDIPRSGLWSRIIKNIDFYLHSNHNPVEIRRFSTGSNALIKFTTGENLEAIFNFVHNEEHVALGVSQFVDAIVFKINIPNNLWKNQNNEKLRSLVVTKYYDLANKGENYLNEITNFFTREWLAQIYLMSLVSISIETNITLEESISIINSSTSVFEDVLSIIFQSEIINIDDLDNEFESQDKLRDELSGYFKNTYILSELERLARDTIINDIDESWQNWLREHYVSTLASAIFYAIEQMCKDLDTTSLLVDIEYLNLSSSLEYDEICISENSSGGIGVIEELISRYGENHKRFWGLVQSALEITESELVDKQLRKTINLVNDDESLMNCFEKIRERKTLDLDKHLEDLKIILNNNGINIYHSFMSSLNNRILRPGSDSKSDEFIIETLDFWNKEEDRLGLEIDLKIISYCISKSKDLDSIFNYDIENDYNSNIEYLKYNIIYGLLWPKGREVRQPYLSIYNPFHKLPIPDRYLISDYFKNEINIVNILNDDNWKEEALKALSESGQVRLILPIEEKYKIKDAFNFLMTNPVENDYLIVYPSIKSIKNDSENIEINLEIMESF